MFLSKRKIVGVVIACLLNDVCAPAFAFANTSVAVLPIVDGNGDAQSSVVAQNISYGLMAATPLYVVDSKKTLDVANYNAKTNYSQKDEIEEQIESAKEDYFAFRNEKAESKLESAISKLKARNEIAKNGQRLVDAYLALTLVSRSRRDVEKMRSSILAALEINPNLEISDNDYPPSIVSEFNDIRREQTNTALSQVEVRSVPVSADVYLNGTLQGRSPVVIKNLKEGRYFIRVSAGQYFSVDKELIVKSEKKLKFNAKLKWRGDDNEKEQSLSENISVALQAAETLHLDKVIFVNANVTGDGKVTVASQMVDRKLQAGHRAVNIDRPANDEDLIALTAQMVSVFAVQSTDDLLKDPTKKIEPLGVGAPIVLGARKRSLTSSPYFWGGVGVLAAGAIAGGVAAALSGSSNDSGSVLVRFK